MFSPRIYWRLFESLNAAVWPAQVVLVGVALAWVGGFVRRCARPWRCRAAMRRRGAGAVLAVRGLGFPVAALCADQLGGQRLRRRLRAAGFGLVGAGRHGRRAGHRRSPGMRPASRCCCGRCWATRCSPGAPGGRGSRLKSSAWRLTPRPWARWVGCFCWRARAPRRAGCCDACGCCRCCGACSAPPRCGPWARRRRRCCWPAWCWRWRPCCGAEALPAATTALAPHDSRERANSSLRSGRSPRLKVALMRSTHHEARPR